MLSIYLNNNKQSQGVFMADEFIIYSVINTKQTAVINH